MTAQIRNLAGDDHHMPDAGLDVLIATGTCIALGCPKGLDIAQLGGQAADRVGPSAPFTQARVVHQPARSSTGTGSERSSGGTTRHEPRVAGIDAYARLP